MCKAIEQGRRLSYALAKQVPDMERGFTIQTNYGDLVIEAEDARAFADLARVILGEKLARAEADPGLSSHASKL